VDVKRRYEPDDPKQSARFVEDARRLDVDESGKPFERVLKKIVVPKDGKKK
jgi:hypothetical protein